MLPVMTRAQIRTRQNRDAGLEPEGYDTDVATGDEVRVEEVNEEPFKIDHFSARIVSVVDHGCYCLLVYERIDTLERGEARIFRGGPPDWGIVEILAAKRTEQRQPEPQTCPMCLAWYNSKSKGDLCPNCKRAESQRPKQNYLL